MRYGRSFVIQFNLDITMYMYRSSIFSSDCKQKMQMSKKGEYVRFKNYEWKIASAFMKYADFESIIVPKDYGKQNTDEFYTSKYQKQVACNYGYN